MGKRLKNIIAENDFTKIYSIEEAVEVAIKSATTKFGNSTLLDKRSLGFKFRIFVRSKSMTFGFFLIFHAVCP